MVSSLYFFLTLAECSMDGNTLTTFNNRKYKSDMPLSCYQVVAQDCTQELKFTVLLKKDNDQNHISVKIFDMWVYNNKHNMMGSTN